MEILSSSPPSSPPVLRLGRRKNEEPGPQSEWEPESSVQIFTPQKKKRARDDAFDASPPNFKSHKARVTKPQIMASLSPPQPAQSVLVQIHAPLVRTKKIKKDFQGFSLSHPVTAKPTPSPPVAPLSQPEFDKAYAGSMVRTWVEPTWRALATPRRYASLANQVLAHPEPNFRDLATASPEMRRLAHTTEQTAMRSLFEILPVDAAKVIAAGRAHPTRTLTALHCPRDRMVTPSRANRVPPPHPRRNPRRSSRPASPQIWGTSTALQFRHVVAGAKEFLQSSASSFYGEDLSGAFDTVSARTPKALMVYASYLAADQQVSNASLDFMSWAMKSYFSIELDCQGGAWRVGKDGTFQGNPALDPAFKKLLKSYRTSPPRRRLPSLEL
ncbi:hypothetical protein P7C70_g5351, partial [Phenoliferia sp. Uapishka_3]